MQKETSRPTVSMHIARTVDLIQAGVRLARALAQDAEKRIAKLEKQRRRLRRLVNNLSVPRDGWNP